MRRKSSGRGLSAGCRSDAQWAGDLTKAAPDWISCAGWRADETHRALSKLLAWNARMKASAVRVAAGVALVSVCTPFPASSQYFPPTLIIVPPPAQEYAAPKQAPKRAQRDSPTPPDTSADAKPKGHYQGRSFIPD